MGVEWPVDRRFSDGRDRVPVLTDVNMPDMDGIEVLKAVKDHDRDVPVIAISGGGVIPSQILLGNAHLLGAYATLDKPFDLDELRAAVESALA